MQQPDPGTRPGRPRTVIAVIVVLVLSALVAGFLIVRAGRAGTDAARTASGSPASGRPVTGGATASGAASTSEVPATCAPGQSGPSRQDTSFTPSGSGTAIPYSVSLPDDYYTACKRYPVIYALHGKTQNNASYLDEAVSMRKAMAAGVLDQAIIVTPDSFSTGRWENRETGPAEDNFIQHLIPHVEQTYRVRPGPSYRLLVGFSMGGHGAIRFGLKYPTMFAAVWSVDGAMSGPEDYLPFTEGRTAADFRIIAVGGQLNGDRVRTLVDGLKGRGIEVQYTHQDLEHEFVAFVDEDEKGGWYAMKYLQQQLGRSF